MNKSLILAAVTAVCASLFAEGNRITWKGGGDTPRWSDGSNWVGGEAPGEKDIAVIPEDTTAWASHHTEANGGDLTFINDLGGICLNGTNATVEIDCQNDGDMKTCCFTFSTSLSGRGRFVVKNELGVNGDRYLRCTADNSAFEGRFVISNALFKVKNRLSLGVKGSPVDLFSQYSAHGVVFEESGVYSNDFNVVKCHGSYPKITTSGDTVVLTNLGSVAVSHGSLLFSGNIYLFGGLYNQTSGDDLQALRLSNVHIGGPGSVGTISIGSGSSLYVEAPLCKRSDKTTFNIYCSGTSSFYLRGPYLTNGTLTAQTGAGKGMRVDLGGYDQHIGMFKYTNTAEPDGTFEVTSEKPATLSFDSTASSSTYYFSGSITGMASLEFTPDSTSKSVIPFISQGNTTRGGLIASNGKFQLTATSAFPNLKRLVARNNGKLLVETAAVNPGKVDVSLAGVSKSLEIADGIQLDARTLKSGESYLKSGVYGSADAQTAHPDLVDADHVLAELSGTGTVKVELDGPPGILMIVR